MRESVGVVGGGIMGSGIAEVAARNGLSTVVYEPDDAGLARSRKRISGSLERAASSGKLSADDATAALDRIVFSTDLSALADRDVIVEAIVEDEAAKVALFARLGELVRPDCLLATNTSSIPVMKLAAATAGPDRVIGIHFFNPVPVLPLVEIIPSLLTSPATIERAEQFAAKRLGKTTILAKDRAGFVVNALLIPYLLAAIRMVEIGFASADDIDTGMVKGCAHPLGPLRLADLIGLDTTAAVAHSMYAEFKEPLFAPPPLLLRMVEAGLLGRKSGRGFFEYS